MYATIDDVDSICDNEGTYVTGGVIGYTFFCIEESVDAARKAERSLHSKMRSREYLFSFAFLDSKHE